MGIDKSLQAGSTTLLLLNLLEEKDLYGYQMIEELESRSENAFSLKAGTLYPLLHKLEQQGAVRSYEQTARSGKLRKYYSITRDGRAMLKEKRSEWHAYTVAVNKVLQGGVEAWA